MTDEYQVEPLPYEYDSRNGISKQVMTWHHDKHYAAYVKGRNAAESKLQKMRESGDFSQIRAVLEAQSFHQSGQVLHEMFFNTLGGDGSVDTNLAVIQKIEQDFGSFDTWKKEFVAAAKTIRTGWVVLVFDPKSGKLHNALTDFHHVNAMWGSTPVMGIDMWEHAFYFDYGPDKAGYVDAFLQNVDWVKVNDLFEQTQ